MPLSTSCCRAIIFIIKVLYLYALCMCTIAAFLCPMIVPAVTVEEEVLYLLLWFFEWSSVNLHQWPNCACTVHLRTFKG